MRKVDIERLSKLPKKALIAEIDRLNKLVNQLDKLADHQENIIVFHEVLAGRTVEGPPPPNNTELHKHIEKLLKEMHENTSRNQH